MGASYSNVKSLAVLDQRPVGAHAVAVPALLRARAGRALPPTEVSWSWQEYLTPPWARLHAVALLWAAGTGIGDKRDGFYLGGFLDQDILRTVFLGRPYCCGFLRGYPAYSLRGESQQLFSAEYRAPLVNIERGYRRFRSTSAASGARRSSTPATRTTGRSGQRI